LCDGIAAAAAVLWSHMSDRTKACGHVLKLFADIVTNMCQLIAAFAATRLLAELDRYLQLEDIRKKLL